MRGGGAPRLWFRGASQVAQQVKNPSAVQETQEKQVQSLGREDPLEEGMATHSSVLAWRVLMDRGAWRATVLWGRSESDTPEQKHTGLVTVGKAPLPLSCPVWTAFLSPHLSRSCSFVKAHQALPAAF